MNKIANIALFGLYAMLAGGCFSIARYQANVRPDTVKPSASIAGKYRLENVVLARSYFAEQGAISEADYVELRWMQEVLKQLKQSEKNKETFLSFFTSAIRSGVGTRINEWDKPSAFAGFARDFAKEMPLCRREIAKHLHEYQEADAAKDTDMKASCITNMVVHYGTMKGMSDMLVHFKSGAEKVTGANVQRLGYKNGKEMFEARFKKDYVNQIYPGGDEITQKMYFNAIRDSLLKNYPTVFTTSDDATPVTALVSFENKFEDHHSYGALLCALGWPYTQQIEVTYRVRVVPKATGRSDADLWSEYADSRLEYPPSPQNCGAVRQREMWTSMLLPFSLIGIPGVSDWPKERKAFTTGSSLITKQRESLTEFEISIYGESLMFYRNGMNDGGKYVGNYDGVVRNCTTKLAEASHEYMERFVFDPVCDGDVIAALVMRALNKMTEARE